MPFGGYKSTLWLAYQYRLIIILPETLEYRQNPFYRFTCQSRVSQEGEDPIQPCHPGHSADFEQKDSVPDLDTEVVVEDYPVAIGRLNIQLPILAQCSYTL